MKKKISRFKKNTAFGLAVLTTCMYRKNYTSHGQTLTLAEHWIRPEGKCQQIELVGCSKREEERRESEGDFAHPEQSGPTSLTSYISVKRIKKSTFGRKAGQM